MISKTINAQKQIHVKHLKASKPSKFAFVWAHGWMRSHEDLESLASQVTELGDQYLLDLPGHANTCPSSATLDIEPYLSIIDKSLANIDKPIIWIGHSFGCRIGAHMAMRHPEKIKALFLICPPFNRIKSFGLKAIPLKIKQTIYKLLVLAGIPRDTLMPYFASRDYLNAGHMRNMFIKWVNEDSSMPLKSLKAPIKLIFAENDQETPPELVTYFKAHCRHMTSMTLKYFDHYSILTNGQHQLIHALINYTKEIQ